MHLIKNKVITLIVALVLSLPLFSQVPSGPFRINEYSCANVSGGPPNIAGSPDWFEIYNRTGALDSVTGWYVSDDPNFIAKWQFPIGSVIPANGYLVVFASGLDTVVQTPREYHTNFDLLQTKPERIILSDANGVVKDSITIRRHQHNHAWARVPNGSGTWRVFAKDSLTGNPEATPGAMNPSLTTAKSYKGYLPTPVFSLQRGFYSGQQQVTLSIPNSAALIPGLELWYTGSAGNTSPNSYIGMDPGAYINRLDKQNFDGTTPITIDSTTVIRAYLDTNRLIATNSQMLPSFVETHTYIIDDANVLPNNDGITTNITTEFNLPVISIAYDSTTSGIYPGSGGGIDYNYMVSMEYFDKNKVFRFGSVGITTPGSGDDFHIPFNYTGYDFSAFDEFGYNYTNRQQLYTDATLGTSARTEQTTISLKAAGSDNFPFTYAGSPGYLKKSAHLRDPLAQTYGMKIGLRLDGSHYQPCIMYINGRYFGIYDIREKFDREYLDFYYGLKDAETDSTEVQVLEQDGALFASSPQAVADWTAVVNHITTNDMRDDALRAVADSMLDFNSLIDLIIYNGYTVNTVFPQKAAWWRAASDSTSRQIKWRYRYFDFEDTYGLDENNAGLQSTEYNASVCQAEFTYGATSTPVGIAHVAIFESLMRSDTFKSQFINRYSFLLNNYLKCPPVIAQLDYIKGLLKPEILQHSTALYGPTLPLLTTPVDTLWMWAIDSSMKTWINLRCPTIVEDIKTCYNVNGPWTFCTDVEPAGAGTVYLNTVGYPEEHSDTYFGNIWFDAIGTPNENYIFDHWELTSFVLPDSMLTNDTLHWLFDSTSCIKAHFKLKEPYMTVGTPAVPTGFSPNGDGNNDLLNVYGTLNIVDYNFQVYNRWGQKIWESSDKTKGWDGTFGGQEVPVGVYAYVFKGTDTDGKLIQKSGNITLIR